jgi:hypothetical protein
MSSSKYVVVTSELYDSFVRSEAQHSFLVAYECEAGEQVIVTDLNREQLCQVEESSLDYQYDLIADRLEETGSHRLYVRSVYGHAMAVFHRRLVSSLHLCSAIPF